MNIKEPKVFVFLIPFVIAVLVIIAANNKSAVEFEADGVVFFIDWKGHNHAIPTFIIKQNNPAGTKKTISSRDFILTQEQIQVGDKFFKKAGSKYCWVISVKIRCIK